MSIPLLIVASGKSSRFGGFPKAFSKVLNEKNVERTIRIAEPYFSHIYLAVNEETYEEYKDISINGKMFSIITGQGDAHSLLRCLNYINTLEAGKNIAVCWGDAVFVNDLPFRQLLCEANRIGNDTPALVACANDENPYAWFQVDGKRIVNSFFASVNMPVNYGLHDQSLFLLNTDLMISYLEMFRKHLGINVDASGNSTDSKEMKLLYSFRFFYQQGLMPAEYVLVDSGNVLSFNTQEELEAIERLLKEENNV